jgi:hypothetical protein
VHHSGFGSAFGDDSWHRTVLNRDDDMQVGRPAAALQPCELVAQMGGTTVHDSDYGSLHW